MTKTLFVVSSICRIDSEPVQRSIKICLTRAEAEKRLLDSYNESLSEYDPADRQYVRSYLNSSNYTIYHNEGYVEFVSITEQTITL